MRNPNAFKCRRLRSLAPTSSISFHVPLLLVPQSAQGDLLALSSCAEKMCRSWISGTSSHNIASIPDLYRNKKSDLEQPGTKIRAAPTAPTELEECVPSRDLLIISLPFAAATSTAG